MTIRSSTALAALVLSLAAATPAMATSRQAADPEIAAALADLEAGRAEAAYQRLRTVEAQKAGDPDFDYTLGLAAADSGRPAEAIIALQRVLSLQPDNAQARAELARAYALAGDIDTARAQFDTVVSDPTLPDPVRQRFDRLVRDYDKVIAGGGSEVSGFVDASIGYDSNINSATDLTQITIPLFAGLGPGALGGAARETSSAFGDLTAGVSGVKATSRQTRLFGSLLGNLRENIEGSAFDQAAITGSAGLGHTLASRDVISLALQAQQYWLGGDSLRQSYGAVAQYTHRLSGGRAVTLSGDLFRLDYDGDPLRDATRFSLGGSYLTRTALASVSVGKEETRRQAGDHLSFGFAQLGLGLEKPVGRSIAIVAGAGAQLREYEAADPLFLTERSDQQVDVTLGLKVPVAQRLSLRPRVTYTRNWSNIALYDFERATASIGLRAEF